jgi:hypothetical protein
VFGLRPKGDGDTEARSRLHLPEGLGNARVPDLSRSYPYPGAPGRGEYRGSDGRNYERWYQEGPRAFRQCPADGCPPARGVRPW